jgi:hypothetical protein
MVAAGEGYHQFKKPKRSGGFRTLNAPAEALKRIQRMLLERVFYSYTIHFAAHGFVRGRSITTNAGWHMNFANHIINFDLKDAFPSTVTRRVKACVGPQFKRIMRQFTQDEEIADQALDIVTQLVTLDNCIPQGSPASPQLLNICCYKLDCQLFDFLERETEETGQEYRYTRYADDLSISSDKEIPGRVKQEIRRIIHGCGWKFNVKKIHDLSRFRGKTLQVTGVNIVRDDGGLDKLAVPTDRLNVYRAILHQLSLNPPADPDKLEEERMRVRGIITYVSLIYGSNGLPSRICAPYLACKAALGLKDRPRRKRTVSLYPDDLYFDFGDSDRSEAET